LSLSLLDRDLDTEGLQFGDEGLGQRDIPQRTGALRERLLEIASPATPQPSSLLPPPRQRSPNDAPGASREHGRREKYDPIATRSAFDSTDRVGFLVLAAGDVTLRRDAVFDWALPFLGAALFVFRDFLEKGRHRLGSVGSRR
jgi:hypothetical protein